MSFEQFKSLVEKYCPNVDRVTQQAHTQENKIGVVYKGSQKFYLYQGTYWDLLGRLGITYVTPTAIAFYKKQIQEYSDVVEGRKPKLSLFKQDDLTREKEQLEFYKNELEKCKGILLLDDPTGKELGVYGLE